jgi:hypothetical protein
MLPSNRSEMLNEIVQNASFLSIIVLDLSYRHIRWLRLDPENAARPCYLFFVATVVTVSMAQAYRFLDCEWKVEECMDPLGDILDFASLFFFGSQHVPVRHVAPAA